MRNKFGWTHKDSRTGTPTQPVIASRKPTGERKNKILEMLLIESFRAEMVGG
jgi:hypothetical protein